ncbi:AAA family ATPase [Pseudoroseicyclus sp. H15]
MEQTSFGTIAPLRNVAALAALVGRLKGRSLGLPGMGTFYGPSGWGKSTAGIYATNKFQAVTVQVKSVWTQKSLCEAIIAEANMQPHRTTGRMIEQIGMYLAQTDVPLIIDEADFLVKRGMIEIVRDIYESSQAPVILIGEENLPQHLMKWERVHGRMLDWVAAQPADIADVGHLAALYAKGIKVERDLQQRILTASKGSIRRISVNLDRAAERARNLGKTTLSVEDWAGELFTGAAPEARRFSESTKRGAA